MSNGSKRLIEAEFATKKFKEKFPEFYKKSKEEQKKILDGINENELAGYADHDEMEITKDQMMTVDYPKPLNRYHLIYEAQHQSIEPIYYWALGHLVNDLGFGWVEKITDIFTASEHSSFWGASAQKLGLQQDKVMTFLATIGKLTKDLFQLVREIRWVDERLAYYEAAAKGSTSAEITLKGLWVDMIDGVVGGQRTASNLFMMSQQLQFVTLPDLFFSIHPEKPEDIDKVVDQKAGGFNRTVRDVLKRKLMQYLVWKKETHKEIKDRKSFTLKYLAQHVAVIKMYMAWVKPYVRQIERLRGDVTKLEKPELIAAFEGSMVEIEILASRIPEGNKNVYACILMTFDYRTRPSMSFAQEGGYHRGPVHVGEVKITWRGYNWTAKQIAAYKKMKDMEDLELLSSIDSSLKAAMDSLGEDLKRYLEEASAEKKKEEEKKEEKPRLPGLFEPFSALGRGVLEAGKILVPKLPKGKGKEADIGGEKGRAEGETRKMLWLHYKNFKKAHGLVTW